MGYGIAIRVRGDYALFTRPEMKVERVSYDVITPSAARGIIEAIYWKPSITWIVDKIHVLNSIQFANFRRNEISDKVSVREAEKRMKGNNEPFFLAANENRQQRSAMVLKNVDYVIEAHFKLVQKQAGENDSVEKHYNMIIRRLRKGQYFCVPCLGTREFAAQVELIEQDKIPASALGDMDLGWMLFDLDFSDPQDIKPIFFKAVMQNGIIDLRNVQVKK